MLSKFRDPPPSGSLLPTAHCPLPTHGEPLEPRQAPNCRLCCPPFQAPCRPNSLGGSNMTQILKGKGATQQRPGGASSAGAPAQGQVEEGFGLLNE